MTVSAIQAVARAVLYEGFILYPYRHSSLKNQQRWTMGGLFPRAWSEQGSGDRWAVRTEVVARGGAQARLTVVLRFLQLVERGTPDAPWQEAHEREVVIAARPLEGLSHKEAFTFEEAGKRLSGELELEVVALGPKLHRVSARASNTTVIDGPGSRHATALFSFASAHVALTLTEGELISAIDPPADLKGEVALCRNDGLWPVLVGSPARPETMLAAPIILSDFPAMAPESRGDLFDGTEIDEILSLRILTLTEAEKAEARAGDPRVRELIDRTEGLTGADLMRMHGARRPSDGVPASLVVDGRRLQAGDRVRLAPKARADIFDVVLVGRIATISSIEQDFEERVHVTVTIDDDPGRDLGRTGQPGHRFFFYADEVEPL